MYVQLSLKILVKKNNSVFDDSGFILASIGGLTSEENIIGGQIGWYPVLLEQNFSLWCFPIHRIK